MKSLEHDLPSKGTMTLTKMDKKNHISALEPDQRHTTVSEVLVLRTNLRHFGQEEGNSGVLSPSSLAHRAQRFYRGKSAWGRAAELDGAVSDAHGRKHCQQK